MGGNWTAGRLAAIAALLLALDVGTLRHLVTATRGGWIAVLMLVVFHTILFSGVQFGIRIMLMARKDGRGGGLRQRIRPNPAPAMAPAATRRR